MDRAHARTHPPDQLSELQHDIFLLIEQRPRPADLEELVAETLQAEGRRQTASGAAPGPSVSRRVVEQAIGELEWLGYIERVTRPAGKLFRLTPWGKAVATSGRETHRSDLYQWRARRRRGLAGEDSRPKRSAAIVVLDRSQIKPSFHHLRIMHLRFQPRVWLALRLQGTRTAGELVQMTSEDLLGVRNIGPKSLELIEAELASVALELRRGSSAAGTVDRISAPAEHREADRDPCWDDKPNLYRVYSLSGGLFDECVEYKRERVLWSRPLMEIAQALDRLPPLPGPITEQERIVRLALDTLIVLVDPEWWRQHSPECLYGEEDRRWLRLIKQLDSENGEATVLNGLAAGREATWHVLEGVVTAAVETFVRARDADGLERCARLLRRVSG